MPYKKSNPPDRIKSLPSKAQDIWISAFNSAIEDNDEESANKIAWSAVKKKYKKDGEGNWVKKASEMKVLEYTLQMDEDVTGETSKIQIMPTGEWDHPSYGEIKITEEDIEKFVEHEDLRNDIPITAGHAKPGEEKPAVGWFKELINKGEDGLWGIVEWTERGKELLKDKAFKYFSPEFHTKYEDPESREVYDNVLVGGALTNIPYFKGLKGVALSEVFCNQEFNMDEEKSKEDLPEDEEEEKVEADEEEEKVEADEEEEEEEEVEEEEEEEEEVEDEAVEASENFVRIEASEYKTLTKKANEGHKAMQELRKKRFDEFVQKWTFGEDNEKGVFLPKASDKVKEFVKTLSEGQLKKFDNILSDVPTKNIFGEQGDDGEDKEETKADKLNKMAEEKADEEDMSYSDAVKIITRENPDLVEE